MGTFPAFLAVSFLVCGVLSTGRSLGGLVGLGAVFSFLWVSWVLPVACDLYICAGLVLMSLFRFM
jgi:hypothetical protein